MTRALFLALLVALLAWPSSATAQRLRLWHAMRGDEQAALERLLRAWREAHPGSVVEVLAVPYDAYASKLESAIPRGHGPDVFIDAHERLASYQSRGLIAPVPEADDAMADYEPTAVKALTYDGRVWAWPLSIKCVALYVNTRLVPGDPPATLEAIEAMRATLPRGVYPRVRVAERVLPRGAPARLQRRDPRRARRYTFVGPEAARSLQRVIDMTRAGVIPEEPSGALVSQLFSTGHAATAISGPWLAAELGDRVPYRVVPLPDVASEGGRPMAPYATVEGAFVSAHSHDPESASLLARFLADAPGAVVRARLGHQVVANRGAWAHDPDLARDPLLATFRAAAARARPMPTNPAMRAAWEPARQAILKALRGDMPPREALEQGLHRFEDVTRPLPRRRDATFALLILGGLAMALVVAALRRSRDREFRVAIRKSVPAYAWVAHAAVIVTALVVAPLVVGAATSLYATRNGESYFVGLANYWDILTARGGPLLATGSFYRVLLVTVLWTAVNLALHLGLGMALALLLARPALKMRALYRVLLIVPWAVPSYVTALAWKGMFHRQFGAINAMVTALGGEPVSWFARFSTAFTANVATNAWLGFPFMMVVTIGALAGIPKDLYEAAEVDGASRWQQFTKITLPMLRPTLGPAAALGAIWTFNQFNVVFLVSGGEPDGETEILVSEAYRWAFTRQAQYGYASAYAVLIFVILALVSRRRAEEAR
ncbi:MAG: extracellular solute-binding protein [Polyangiales bacterium]